MTCTPPESWSEAIHGERRVWEGMAGCRQESIFGRFVGKFGVLNNEIVINFDGGTGIVMFFLWTIFGLLLEVHCASLQRL
jgi:hypothetical protein